LRELWGIMCVPGFFETQCIFDGLSQWSILVSVRPRPCMVVKWSLRVTASLCTLSVCFVFVLVWVSSLFSDKVELRWYMSIFVAPNTLVVHWLLFTKLTHQLNMTHCLQWLINCNRLCQFYRICCWCWVSTFNRARLKTDWKLYPLTQPSLFYRNQMTHGRFGSVVLGRWTCDREIAGSTPGRCTAG